MARVFVSFVHEDQHVAEAVHHLITKEVGLDFNEVFLSSDLRQVSPGDPWVEKIRVALQQCEVLVSMLSARSVRRPWINFEAGAVWIRKQHVIPVCYGNMSKGALPLPYLAMQAVNIPEQAGDLVQGIAKQLGIPPPRPRHLAKGISDGEAVLRSHTSKSPHFVRLDEAYTRLESALERWTDALIDVHTRQPLESSPAPTARVEKMRDLLREAATEARRRGKDSKGLDERNHLAWFIGPTIRGFLRLAFVEPPLDRFKAFGDAEMEKRGRHFEAGEVCAQFLEALAERVQASDIDAGFLMPDRFEQFDPTKWPKPNR
jgi:hypothetical protein